MPLISTLNFNGSTIRWFFDEAHNPWFVVVDVLTALNQPFDDVSEDWVLCESGLRSFVGCLNNPRADDFRAWLSDVAKRNIEYCQTWIVDAPTKLPEPAATVDPALVRRLRQLSRRIDALDSLVTGRARF